MGAASALMLLFCGIGLAACSRSACPNPCQPVTDPCTVGDSGCGAFDYAQCRANYCNNCIKEYFVPSTSRQVDCSLPKCSATQDCTSTQCVRIDKCVRDSECGYDEYCCNDCCGARCLKRDSPPPPPPSCYGRDPCDGSYCAGFGAIEVECKATYQSYSGRCTAQHYLEGTSRQVNCSMERCPNESSCAAVTCFHIPSYECVHNDECLPGWRCCRGCCGPYCIRE